MGETGTGDGRGAGTPGRSVGFVFALLTVVVVWGATAVVLHQLLGLRWGLSLGVAPALFMVALILRNALHFRRRRRLRPQREG